MKATVNKQTIAPAIKKLAKVGKNKASAPIFTHIACNFDSSTLEMTANDGKQTYSVQVEATGEEGRCTLEADKLSRSVQSMSAGEIELSDGQVKQGRSRLKLATMDYDHFPMPDHDQADEMPCSADELSSALAQVAHCMAKNDVRYYLNGVFLSGDYAVATDGHRLAWAPVGSHYPAILPADSVYQIIGMSGSVLLGESQLIVEQTGERFTTKLVEGRYPDWQKVIPSEAIGMLTFNREEAIGAIQQALIGGDMMRVALDDGALVLSNEGAESAINVQVDGQVDQTGVHGQYLIDALKSIDDESVEMRFHGSNKPMLVGDHNVVMPCRV